MTEAEEILLVAGGQSTIPLVPTLPADASLYAGQVYLAPRWPLLASAPGTVVNGQRFRLAGGTYGIEYLGVGGSWVPQPSVTMGVWQSDGSEWWPLSPIPILDELPADDSTFGTVVIVGGDVFMWNGSQWIYRSPLTLNGETVTINGEPITGIPFGTKILLNEDGQISLNENGKIAMGE